MDFIDSRKYKLISRRLFNINALYTHTFTAKKIFINTATKNRIEAPDKTIKKCSFWGKEQNSKIHPEKHLTGSKN